MAVAERILHLRPPVDTRPDRALIHEAQRGRQEAATTLIERYYPRIYSFVSHLNYGRGNGEDLTQEVFARALKALNRFNGQYQFEHWLLRIAKNLCIDEARRSLRSPELTDPVELPQLEGIPAPDYVWESVSRELVAGVVRRALAALPARQRAVLVLREMEGLPYADIAQVVGTNPRGVEATLRRARARFRMEVPRAEAAEEAAARCRRVLRLVSEAPEASSAAAEAAAHLASCADCRRRAQVIVSGSGAVPAPKRRSFGAIPSILGLGTLLRGHGVAAAVRRLSDRLKDSLPATGVGTSAAMAVPLARMAEVAGGVFVATAVTLAPTATLAHPAGVAAAQVEPVAAPQVDSVAPVSVLYRSSPGAAVTAGPVAAASQAPAALQAPSIVASPDAQATGIPGLLTQLGLVPSQDAVAATLNNVSTISIILADQLSQVAALVNSTIDQVPGVLGQPVGQMTEQLTAPVGKIATGLTNQLSGTLRSVGGQVARVRDATGTVTDRTGEQTAPTGEQTAPAAQP